MLFCSPSIILSFSHISRNLNYLVYSRFFSYILDVCLANIGSGLLLSFPFLISGYFKTQSLAHILQSLLILVEHIHKISSLFPDDKNSFSTLLNIYKVLPWQVPFTIFSSSENFILTLLLIIGAQMTLSFDSTSHLLTNPSSVNANVMSVEDDIAAPALNHAAHPSFENSIPNSYTASSWVCHPIFSITFEFRD